MAKVQALHNCFQSVVTVAFAGDKLKEALEHSINLDVCAAQFLLYLDVRAAWRQAMKRSAAEVDGKLQYKYLSDTDIFEDFYKQHLAQRLLYIEIHSNHHEKAMIVKLKSGCGQQYRRPRWPRT